MAEPLELLGFGNKQENNGADNRGRLTAHEFNQTIQTINQLLQDVSDLKGQLGGFTIDASLDEVGYEALETKDPNTIYILLER